MGGRNSGHDDVFLSGGSLQSIRARTIPLGITSTHNPNPPSGGITVEITQRRDVDVELGNGAGNKPIELKNVRGFL